MQTSEKVKKVNVAEMARVTGLSQSAIKIALTRPTPRPNAIERFTVTNFEEAVTLLQNVTSRNLKMEVLMRALEYCTTFDNINHLKGVIDRNIFFQKAPTLNALYIMTHRRVARDVISKANDLRSLYTVWTEELGEDYLAEENTMAFEKIKTLIPSVEPVEALEIIEDDMGVELYNKSDYGEYDLILLVCRGATPQQALEVLVHNKTRGPDHKGDSEPIVILVKKVSTLFPK